MFRLMSYILNSKLIDESESSGSRPNINAEQSSSSQSETNPESDVPEDDKSESDSKNSDSVKRVVQSKESDQRKTSVEAIQVKKNSAKKEAMEKPKLKEKPVPVDIKNEASERGKSEEKEKPKFKLVKPNKEKSKIEKLKATVAKNKSKPSKPKTPNDKSKPVAEKPKPRLDSSKVDLKVEKRKLNKSSDKSKTSAKHFDSNDSSDSKDNVPLKKLKLQPRSSTKEIVLKGDKEEHSETGKKRKTSSRPNSPLDKDTAKISKLATDKTKKSLSKVESKCALKTSEKSVVKDTESSISKADENNVPKMAEKNPLDDKEKATARVLESVSKNIVKKGSISKGKIEKKSVTKTRGRPPSTSASASNSPSKAVETKKLGEETPKKPQSEIERLKELEAKMAASKSKLKLAKNIVQELKEKDEQLLKAKTGDLFREEKCSNESSVVSRSEMVQLPPPMKLSPLEPNYSSTSYDDVKSPSTGTFSSCVSPCFSEESQPSMSASQKDESNDGFNESVERSISPSNSESIIMGPDNQRSRSRKRLLGKPKKKSSSNSRRSSRSVSEDGSVESPSKLKRIPKRPGIIFEMGCKLEAMDFQEKWYMAKVVEIDQAKAEILIHFDGWSSRYDEWISMHSKKLRAVAQPCPGKRDPKEKSCQQFKMGEKVLARWTDSKMYPASIKEAQVDNYYLVEFFDGFVRRLSYSCIAKVPTEVVEKLTHPLPVAAVKKLKTEDKITKDPLLKNILNRSSTDDDASVNSPSESFVPKKQFKVEEDHNQFKCHFEKCNKSFRKESLLASHIKHYHRPKPAARSANSPRKVPKVKSTPKPAPLPEPLASPPVDDVKIKIETEEASVSEEPSNSIVIVAPVKGEINIAEESPLTPAVPVENSTLPTQCASPLPKTPVVTPTKSLVGKGGYPITKMETRHAKLRFQKDDSVYTNYKTVALGIQRPRRTSEGRFEKVKLMKDLKIHGRMKSPSESTMKVADVKPVVSVETKKTGKIRGERKISDSLSGKSDAVKKVKVEKDDESQDKKDVVGPATRRKSDLSISKEDVTKEEIDEVIEINDETNDEREDNGEDDEVVHCICEVNEENGLMIQCEVCMTWQHGSCFNIEELNQVPDKYICYACTNPRGLRKSFKYRLDQEWFKNGELATFNEMGTNCKQSCSILASHELVSSMHKVVNALHSLDYKINLAKDGSKDQSDLRYFSKPWKALSASNESLNESTLTAKTSNFDAELTLDAETTERVLKAIANEGLSDTKETMLTDTIQSFMNDIKTPETSTGHGMPSLDHSYFSVKDTSHSATAPLKISEEPSAEEKAHLERANLNSACSSTDSTTATTTTTTEDTDGLDPIEFNPTAEKTPLDRRFTDDFSDSESELRMVLNKPNPPVSLPKPKGKAAVSGGTRKRGRSRRGAHFCHQPLKVDPPVPKPEEIINVEACNENLLDHITDVQNNLESKLEQIEGQLKILEVEYGENKSDQDQYMVDSEDGDDLPRLLHSIKNLTNDLSIVERLAVI